MKAGELCIREVFTAEADEPLYDVARRMAAEDVGDLVVVVQKDGIVRPVGIVTDRDLVLRALVRTDLPPGSLHVRDIMQVPPITAFVDEEVEVVLAKLERYTVRRIPIVSRAGGLEGILTLDDILTWIAELMASATRLVDRQAHHRPPR